MSGSHVSVASVAVPGVPDVQFVNADFFKQQYAAVPLSHRGGATLTSNAGPALVKIQRGSSVYQAGVPGQVMILKTDKEETSTPAGEEVAPAPTPTHTTKSSSLSRDISPSRITAQVVSAMSESSNQQPLLFTALTGKLPTSLMLSTRPDAPQVKQADDHRASPFERRHSPVAVDGRGQGENKGTKAQSVPSTLPFENLMRAAALFKAQEIQGGSSPSRPPGAGPQQQGSVNQVNEGRTQTPSPKSTARSHQGQRRSPVRPGSRPSPVPSPGQEVLTIAGGTMSGGVMQIPMQQMGLVQQHLLAATLASATSAANTHSKPTPATCAHPGQHLTVPPAPVVPSVPQATVKLTTIPIDMAAVQKAKGGKNSHVISVGTGTDIRRFTSYGAQTEGGAGLGEGVKVKQEEAGPAHAFHFHRKDEGSHGLEPAARGQAVGPANVTVTVGMVDKKRVSPVDKKRVSPVDKKRVSPVMSTGVAGHGGAGGSVLSSVVTPSSSKPFTTLSSFSALSSAVDIAANQTGSGVEHRKRHAPLPTAAHGNKPIPVPSSHAHVHIHQPSAPPRPHIPVTSASMHTSPATCISTAPSTQPVVSLSRLPTPTSLVQTDAVRVKVEPRVAPSLPVTTAKYQPRLHQYHEHSQPAQTITSHTVKAGPVVKDFIPVVEPPEPVPFHQPPLPAHINPFTFPTSGVKVHYASGDKPSYSLISQDSDTKALQELDTKAFDGAHNRFTTGHKSVSDVTGLRPHHQFADTKNLREEMPRLTPEGLLPPKTEASLKSEGVFNHVEPSPVDGKEQLISPFNQRLQNLNNFPSMATSYRSAYRSQSVAMQRAKAGIIMSSARSLDLLRQNIQKIINKELDGIVQKYVEKFFKPAAENIRLNNGSEAVSEEHVNTVCRQIFEEAKRMYTTEARRSVTPISDFPDNVSESGSLNGKRVSPNPLSKRLKASDSDSERGSDGGVPKKVPRRKGRPPLNSSGRSTPLKPVVKMDSVKREGPRWDPERIKPETLFIMGARANKALGLGNTRGRLYIRHPDIFKYSGDQEDKVWLHEQKLMPATGGKAYMLIVEDIIHLSKTEDYRESPTLMMHECRGFEVPEWMRVKIKESMQAMRSDGPKRSRSRSPLTQERPEPPKSLPFSNFSDTASNNDLDSIGNKNSLQPSPADTEEIEFLSAVDNADNEDTQPSDVSSFNVTGGFDDTSSHSPCPLERVEEDPPLATPFT